MAQVSSDLGTILLELGAYSDAYSCYLYTLDYYTSQDDVMGIALTKNNLGSLFRTIGDFQRATEYLDQACTAFESLGLDKHKSYATASKAAIFAGQSMFEASILLYEDAIAAMETHNDHHALVTALTGLGEALGKKGDLRSAVEVLDRAVSISLHQGIEGRLASALLSRADVILFAEHASDSFDQILADLHQAKEIAQRLNQEEILVDAFESLSLVYEKKGNIPLAFENLKAHKALKKHLSAELSLRKVSAIEAERRILDAEKERALVRKHNEELQGALENISRLNSELSQKNNRLVQLNREKAEFLGIASHDLKNPLTSIRLAASMLVEMPRSFSPEQTTSHLRKIVDLSSRMAEIITRFLDDTRQELVIETSTDNDATDVSRLVRTTIDSHFLAADVKNIIMRQVNLSVDPWARIDEVRAFQILDNLISNAVKYSHRGGDVTVTIEDAISEQDTDVAMLRIQVQDSGPGLSHDDISKLFGRYQRLSAQPTGNESSTGLGLYITKKLVDGIGGKIWCESKPGYGSQFFVLLPKATRD